MKNLRDPAARKRRVKQFGIPVMVLAGLTAAFVTAVFYIENITNGQNLVLTKQAAVRTAVECYATEGIYPPDVKYMEKNYGLTYDHTKYVIFYDVFASNIMPQIEVYEKR